MPVSGLSAAGRGTEVDRRTLDLIATVIERCEVPGEPGPGHPPAETVRVLATLRRFLREGTPLRSLRATATGCTRSERPGGRCGVVLPGASVRSAGVIRWGHVLATASGQKPRARRCSIA